MRSLNHHPGAEDARPLDTAAGIIREKPGKKTEEIKMKATWNTKEGYINSNDRKENKFYRQLTGLVYDAKDGGNIREAVILRLYATDARTYACVWCFSPYTAGSAHAGGYGYHRASAAAEEAFRRAGFSFDEEVGGCGDSVMRKAVEAVCRLTFPGCPCTVVEAYA